MVVTLFLRTLPHGDGRAMLMAGVRSEKVRHLAGIDRLLIPRLRGLEVLRAEQALVLPPHCQSIRSSQQRHLCRSAKYTVGDASTSTLSGRAAGPNTSQVDFEQVSAVMTSKTTRTAKS